MASDGAAIASGVSGNAKIVSTTLQLKVLETRGIKVEYCRISCEQTERLTKNAKRKDNEIWGDSFSFDVKFVKTSDMMIQLWYKPPLKKEKCTAQLHLSLQTLLADGKTNKWFPLAAPTKKGKLKEKEKDKQKEKTYGEIRLDIDFQVVYAKEEVRGLVCESEWTEKLSGGALLTSSRWLENPQFLLTVKNKTTKLSVLLNHLTESCDKRMTFYTYHYDEWYNGREQVVLKQDQIVKVGDINAPLFDSKIAQVLTLAQGKYVLVPCTEEPDFHGRFRLNVVAGVAKADDNDSDSEGDKPSDGDQPSDTESLLGLSALPLTEDLAWAQHSISGEWTEANSGGGNVAGRTNWVKNPQFRFIVHGVSQVCVTLHQEAKDNSVGLYVCEFPESNGDKKIFDYKDEVGKTEKFQYSNYVGVENLKIDPGVAYVVIPCFFEQGAVGAFTLTVHTNRKAKVDLSELTAAWKYRCKLKGQWKGVSAGGSPNNPETFWNNPQFLLTPKSNEQFDVDTSVIIQLTQQPHPQSIGFLAFPREKNDRSRMTHAPPTGMKAVLCQPQGWAETLSVVVPCKLSSDELTDNSVLILPSTFAPGIKKAFNLLIWSDIEMDLEPLDDIEDKGLAHSHSGSTKTKKKSKKNDDDD